MQTSEQRERLKIACQALRANPLKTKGRMKDREGGRCCLKVMYDSAIEQGAALPPHNIFTPPRELFEFFGMPSPGEGSDTKVNGENLSTWNDGIEVTGIEEELPSKSHIEIAEMIEKEYNL